MLIRENQCRRQGFDIVAGIDEAGRGPLAGPVAAAAVAVVDLKSRNREMDYLFGEVRDSKKLSERKRDELYDFLVANNNIVWGCAMVSEKIIDKINILEASKMAMANALADLEARQAALFAARRVLCLIDGNFSINIPHAQRSIIAGDAKVFSISAASIIAKVTRDRFMLVLDEKYPAYGFSRHKGYPTKQHVAALRVFGASPVHRMSFAPCAASAKNAIIK